jgi:hypothetical protein
MTVHRILIEPDIFEALVSGQKTADVLYNDENYKVGDVIEYVNWKVRTTELATELRVISHIEQIEKSVYVLASFAHQEGVKPLWKTGDDYADYEQWKEFLREIYPSAHNQMLDDMKTEYMNPKEKTDGA